MIPLGVCPSSFSFGLSHSTRYETGCYSSTVHLRVTPIEFTIVSDLTGNLKTELSTAGYSAFGPSAFIYFEVLMEWFPVPETFTIRN